MLTTCQPVLCAPCVLIYIIFPIAYNTCTTAISILPFYQKTKNKNLWPGCLTMRLYAQQCKKKKKVTTLLSFKKGLGVSYHTIHIKLQPFFSFPNINISWLSFHINPYKPTSSFLKLLYSIIYHSLFNSSINVYFGCFQPFIIDKTAKNIFNTIPNTFSWVSLGFSWSCGLCIFNIDRYCQIALQNIWTNLYSSKAWEYLVLHIISTVDNINSFFNIMGEKITSLCVLF